MKWWHPNDMYFFMHSDHKQLYASSSAHKSTVSQFLSNAVVTSWFCWALMALSLVISSLPVHMSLSCRILTCDFSSWFILHVCSHHCFLGTGNTQLNLKVYRMNQTGEKMFELQLCNCHLYLTSVQCIYLMAIINTSITY